MLKLLYILLFALTLAGCLGEEPKELILFDFETDAELDQIHWKCFTMFGLSNEHVAHGSRSLKMELYPSNWPGWAPKLGDNDWRSYEFLAFDLHNPADKEVAVTVRIDDRKDYPDYGERFNQQFVIKPGANSIRIPLQHMMTSGTRRNLDLDRIYRFLIFMGSPKQKQVLYLDYVRLVNSDMLGS